MIALVLTRWTGDSRDATALTAVKLWMDDCVRNLDRLTAPIIARDYEFWNQLPLLMETLFRRQYASLFECCLLFCANSDSRQELLIEDEEKGLTGLEEFFMDYVHITLHMVRQDIMFLRLLAEEPETQLPDSPTQRWLQFLAWLLTFSNIPFYRTLEAVHDTDAFDFVLRIRAKTFATPIDAPGAVAEYASLLLETTPKFPSLLNNLVSSLLLANSITDCTLEKMQNEQDSHSETATDLSADSPFLKIIYDTVRQIDDKYQQWVIKKSPLVSSDFSEHMLRQIPRVYSSLCQSDPTFMERISKDLKIQLPIDVNTESKTRTITWGWKFAILKKLIIEGRMELRVHGVETMQSDLVTIWRQHISNDATGVASPEIQYLVHFIQSNKIVDYLVGVDSHPQLISRSSNIVGFLIVTNTYTNLETDVIWKAVTESQDSRIVSEVLAMLTRTFYMHPTASPALLYVCKKVLELPLEQYDARMLEFCDNLLGRMSEKPTDHGYYDQPGDHVDAVPLWLCVRLIRESTAADNLSDEQRTQLQNFGSKQLATFIKTGINEADRTEIYERCIQDIAEMNEFTAGSMQALNALVPMHDAQEINKLATDYDLTRLVITDLLHTVNGDHVNLSDAFSQHGLVSRVVILFRLVDNAPETITPELGLALWNEILLSSKLGYDGHKTVWNMMVTALTRCSKPNPFLDRCIHEYLPSLVPKDYSPELLAFTKMSVTYEVRFNPPPAAGENEVVTIPGMDRIWNFILTSPPGSIEDKAIDYAIKTYLDHPVIKISPRSAVEATHIAIADRCIDQLKSSAAALRPSETVAANGETAMGPETLDGEIGPEELRFRRSLQFLYRLLHGLQARPQYVSPRGSPPSLPERPLKGDPIDLSWQWFNGSTSSGVKTLRIGGLSTAAELVEMLSRLSGFSKFSAICGGQRLDLFDDLEALVQDIKVLHSGLLILRKAPDAQEVSRDNGRHSFTSVDSEVLKHFDEIYAFLALKENVAREVSSILLSSSLLDANVTFIQVYDFLAVFPPPERILELVKSEQNNEDLLFPFEKPFVAFYSFHVLLMCLRDEATETTPNQSFASHSIDILVAFLMADQFASGLSEDTVKFWLASNATECLLAAFVIYGTPGDDAALVQDPIKLVKRLLEFIQVAHTTPALPFSTLNQKLIRFPFAVLIDGSTRDEKFWNAVKQEAHFDQLIESLLLNESRQSVRIDVAERIKITCGPLKPQKQPLKTNEEPQSPSPAESTGRIDMLATVWDAFLKTIPKAPEYASQSAEFFTVALWVFRSVAEKSPRDVIFSQYLKQWSLIMLEHHTEEVRACFSR